MSKSENTRAKPITSSGRRISAGANSSSDPKIAVPRGVWSLGFVSLFMDVSSEMIHGLLPVFLVSVLGASTTMVGLIEGVGEATASFVKLPSGWLSDRVGTRKWLAVLGYGLGALSKPLFALAPTTAWVLAARISDRLGKGMRGAPRDALVADLTPPSVRGAAYGLRQSLDSVGAFAGPLLAVGLMYLFHDRFRLVFWLALIPGFISVAILAIAVKEPHRVKPHVADSIKTPRVPLGRLFWRLIIIASFLMLARFSEAFLILRARGLGLPLALAPIVLALMSLVYALASYPAGRLSDRVGRRRLLIGGFVVLIAANLVLATATGLWQVAAGVVLWGLHMGLTQGLLAAFVADTAPQPMRGTAFGIFNFAIGISALLASLIAGALWQFQGASFTFYAGAASSAIGLLLLNGIGRAASRPS